MADLEASLVNAQIQAELHNDIKYHGEEEEDSSAASGMTSSQDTGKEIFNKKDGENNEDDSDNAECPKRDGHEHDNPGPKEDGETLGKLMEGEDGSTGTLG